MYNYKVEYNRRFIRGNLKGLTVPMITRFATLPFAEYFANVIASKKPSKGYFDYDVRVSQN